MSNIKSIINSQKLQVLQDQNSNDEKENTCNCRSKINCPLNGNWSQSNVIYKATVNYEGKEMDYIGSTSLFKTKYSLHRALLTITGLGT